MEKIGMNLRRENRYLAEEKYSTVLSYFDSEIWRKLKKFNTETFRYGSESLRFFIRWGSFGLPSAHTQKVEIEFSVAINGINRVGVLTVFPYINNLENGFWDLRIYGKPEISGDSKVVFEKKPGKDIRIIKGSIVRAAREVYAKGGVS